MSQTFRRREKPENGPAQPTKGRSNTNLRRQIADELEDFDFEHLYHRPERYTGRVENTTPRP